MLDFFCLIPQGSSWLHVGTDQPFRSISIGGANQVWAIAKDGAVFYRGSVSPQNPAGRLKMPDLDETLLCRHEVLHSNQNLEEPASIFKVYRLSKCTNRANTAKRPALSSICRRMLVPHPLAPPTDPQAAVCGEDLRLRRRRTR